MINRAAILLKYKSPALNWINQSNPTKNDPEITLESVNSDRMVYLIQDADADTPDNVEVWIKLNFEALFESELDGWYTDESLWPKNRDLKLFQQWFDVECHTMIVDTVGGILEDDEL